MRTLRGTALFGLLLFLLTISGSRQGRGPAASAKRTVAQAVRGKAASGTPSGIFIRAQYPYSVVAGGVYNGEELARARRTDRVVREHYENFGDRPEFSPAAKDLLVYVSYRKHDRVYWTKARHVVKRGEMVVTDGEQMARARCGNRLSERPQSPTEAEDEPTEDVLAMPEAPKVLNALSNTALPDLPEVSSYVPPSAFSDLPMTPSPVNGGTVEVPVGSASPASTPMPSFPNTFSRSLSVAPPPSGEEQPAATTTSATTTPTGSPSAGGGNDVPSDTPTGGGPTFEPPFVPPRPPLAPVPEPVVTKMMWVLMLGGLGLLGIRKAGG